MTTWVALLRGINVGGGNRLPMRDLVALLEGLGLEDVRTYIRSGNVVFRTPARNSAGLSRRIEDAIETGFGFRPRVMVRTLAELLRGCALRRLRFQHDAHKRQGADAQQFGIHVQIPCVNSLDPPRRSPSRDGGPTGPRPSRQRTPPRTPLFER